MTCFDDCDLEFSKKDSDKTRFVFRNKAGMDEAVSSFFNVHTEGDKYSIRKLKRCLIKSNALQ